MTNIPKVQTENREVNQLQNNILSVLNPLLKAPLISGNILPNISLASGLNTINHLLNRQLIGWIIIRQRGSAQIYDAQDTNTNQTINLILNSNSNVSVDLYVF